MKRRAFIQNSFATMASSAALPAAIDKGAPGISEKIFKLNYAPHDGMFKNSGGPDFLDQIRFMADQGFRAVEDNGMLARSISDQDKIGRLLSQLNMTMGVFVVDGGDNWKMSLTTGKKEFIDNFIKTCKLSLETAKRVDAKWVTVVPGFFERKLPIGIQTSNVIEALRRGTELFESMGLVMVLEPLSDTPDLFLRNSDQTYSICKAVNSPSCKILFDIYHMQRNEGNIINNIDACWDEIAYIQIGDNPGRNEPGTGEINYANIFKYLYKKGYNGVLGMEHGNSVKDKSGELAVISAYREADNF